MKAVHKLKYKMDFDGDGSAMTRERRLPLESGTERAAEVVGACG